MKNQRIWKYSFVLLWIVLSGCMLLNATAGPIWLDDPIITSGLDSDGDPIDQVEVFGEPITRVYCFLTIRGPDQVQLGVRWYHQDELIWTDVMQFGSGRKTAVFLARENNEPFPPGDYRCEIYAVEEPLRTAPFRVE